MQNSNSRQNINPPGLGGKAIPSTQQPSLQTMQPNPYSALTPFTTQPQGPPYFAARAMMNESLQGRQLHDDGHFLNSGSPTSSIQPGQLAPMATMQNPKRPYRQRRKDPSCDACRERKVKCDATETSSCTECSSRNVRCQFTKDTNKRMSSIKQMQDLERQLIDTRHRLEHYQNQETHSEGGSTFSSSPLPQAAELPDFAKSPRRMLKAKSPAESTVARSYMIEFGKGLLKPPVLSVRDCPQQRRQPSGGDLPSSQVAEILVEAYFQHVCPHFPVLYWPDFRRSCGALYGPGEHEVPQGFSGVFYAVMACGSLFVTQDQLKIDGNQFIEEAVSNLTSWDETSVIQATTASLISWFMFETNRKQAAWMWVGIAVRVAQCEGLHVQGGQWSEKEGEMRKRVWYSLYVWERLMAMEIGKPMMIDDDDCDTEYPGVFDEDNMNPGNHLHRHLQQQQQPTRLLAAIHVARLLASLANIFRSLCITSSVLNKFEAHLHHCWLLMSEELGLSDTNPLDPSLIAPAIYLQNARLLLYRHNISPACSAEQRLYAISQCVSTAENTARIVARCIAKVSPANEEPRLASVATATLCTHLWRCMLFLIFRQQYEPFLVLLRAAAMIDDRRIVNVCCGRYLGFFIERLIERFENDHVPDLDQDEEMIIYVSGDLQSGTNSWVWGNIETGTLLSRRQKHGRQKSASEDRTSASPGMPSMAWDSELGTQHQGDWGSWLTIQHKAGRLQQLTERNRKYRSSQGLSPHPSASLTPDTSRPSGVSSPQSPSTSQASKSRMNIASII